MNEISPVKMGFAVKLQCDWNRGRQPGSLAAFATRMVVRGKFYVEIASRVQETVHPYSLVVC